MKLHFHVNDFISRNYTPKESNDMLREMERKRNNARKQEQAAKMQKSSGQNNKKAGPKKSSPQASSQPLDSERDLRKTSVERMIEDFHRNLPPPQFEGKIKVKGIRKWQKILQRAIFFSEQSIYSCS